MATRNFRPNATNEGSIGTTLYRWAAGFINNVTANDVNTANLNVSNYGYFGADVDIDGPLYCGDSVNFGVPLPVASGGTGASTATAAAGNLGVYTKAESNTRLNALAPRQGVLIPASTGNTTITGLNFGLSDFSISVDVLPSVVATSISNVCLSHSTGTNIVWLYFRSTQARLRWVDNSGVATNTDITLSTPLPDNVFFRVTVTCDRDGLATAYLNGAAIGTVDISALAAIDIGSGNTNRGLIMVNQAFAGVCGIAIHNFAIPATTTSGVVGVAERYADGVWVRPSERVLPASNLVPADHALAVGAADGTTVTTTVLNAATVAAFAGARTGGAGAQVLRATMTGDAILRVAPPALFDLPAGAIVRFSVWVKPARTSNIRIGGSVGSSITATFVTSSAATGGEWYNYAGLITLSAASTSLYIRVDSQLTGDVIDIDDFEVEVYGASLDLQPQGIGRTIIDRSANRNHATVSGTTLPTYLQPTDGGKIVTRTNATPNQQLLALAAFDAANRYRITSWTVTALTGTPTISLGNASAGAQYVNGLALSTGVPTAVTLATTIAATANLWVNSNSTDVIIHTITYERISD